MTRQKLPKHVQAYVTPWGKQVYYLRLPGRPKIRIQVADDVLPWSPTFNAALEAATEKLSVDSKQIVNRPPVAGTVNAALIGYYDSTVFKDGLGKTTQQNRRAILERLIRTEHGDKRTHMMHAQALQAIMSKLKPNPQRNFKRSMRHFIKYCIGLGLMTADPLASVTLTDRPKSKGFHAWTDDEVEQYRAKHKPGTKARLALEVLLMTGHARSDVVRMGDQRVKGGRLTMARQKTGTAFSIQLLPELVAELALHRRDGAVSSMVWLTTERGTPFGSAASFGNWFAAQCREAGVPGRAHGLRKASAIRQAMHGATPYELMAWHGWKTIDEAQRYCEQANKMRLADNAAAKLISGTKIVSAADPLSQIAEKHQ
ncbi:hypothetical protein [Bradyrhizobium sp. Ash2021]|uniref:tyrosine-type recombinase/integrase n=1 Tax=Bradyrhizobium sp. Ash2021 TaxID=2954771 RepID=UPI0028153FF8|nr:hypothetical protein [Bradyrhizobium sp. Ash2021]WMT77443.1 hypothetical protein NL528_14285 [Bradyrhizobium sp. Ash2021]